MVLKQNFSFVLNHPVGLSTAAIAIIALLLVVAGYLPALVGALLLPFALGLWSLNNIPHQRLLLLGGALLITVLLGFFMALYRPGGFDYPLLWQPGVLHEGGQPFALYVNLAKALGGYLVIIWLLPGLFRRESAPGGVMGGPQSLALVLVGIGGVFLSAYAIFGLSWQPKVPGGIAYFVLVNLLVTVVSEEAFFRLLLQRQIQRFFVNKTVGITVAVLLSATIFALAHTAAVGPMFYLFLLAGLVYALVYVYTGRLTASIATHFGVNMAHILFLEYPL
jgi:uncharacterized protein